MTSEPKPDKLFTVLLIVAMLASFGLGVYFRGVEVKMIRTEAIKRGAAEWVVSPEGQVAFQWKGKQ